MAAERTMLVHVLWADLPDSDHGPQFVAAFLPNEWECDPERPDAAKAWFRDFLDDGERVEFYDTTAQIPVPDDNPNRGRQDDG